VPADLAAILRKTIHAPGPRYRLQGRHLLPYGGAQGHRGEPVCNDSFRVLKVENHLVDGFVIFIELVGAKPVHDKEQDDDAYR